MKAMFLKDFYMMKKQLCIYLVVMVVYTVLFVPQGMADMLAFMSIVFCMMSVVTSMSFDETLKWDRYALSGPLSRRQLVRARYAWGLLVMAIGYIFGALSYVALPLFGIDMRPLTDSLALLAGGCLTAILALSVMIPCIYKLGAEKARLLLIGSVLLPVGAIMLYARYAPAGLKLFFTQYANLLPIVLLLVVIIAVCASYKISLHICNNKDF